MIYRGKYIFDNLGYTKVSETFQDGIIAKNVYVAKKIDNGIIVKYLDRNGLLRFYQFCERYSDKISTKNIGDIMNITGNASTLGYTAERVINIGASVEPLFWAALKDIFYSPLIEAKINSNWYRAKINDGQYVIRKGKGEMMNIEIQLKIYGMRTIQR